MSQGGRKGLSLSPLTFKSYNFHLWVQHLYLLSVYQNVSIYHLSVYISLSILSINHLCTYVFIGQMKFEIYMQIYMYFGIGKSGLSTFTFSPLYIYCLSNFQVYTPLFSTCYIKDWTLEFLPTEILYSLIVFSVPLLSSLWMPPFYSLFWWVSFMYTLHPGSYAPFSLCLDYFT